MPRILQCLFCKTADILPDYEGHPDDDFLLQKLIDERHTTPGGTPHVGNLLVISKADWDKLGGHGAVSEALTKETGEIYASRDTYREDALKCYAAHNSPEQGCIDWYSPSKRIGRPTDEGRQHVKDNPKVGDRDPHLCSFCPVAVWVQTQVRTKRGAYNS